MNKITLAEFILIPKPNKHGFELFSVEFENCTHSGEINSKGEHILWSNDGYNFICSWVDAPNIDEVSDKLRAVAEGKYACCECGKVIDFDNKRIFAGVYCSDCWTEKRRQEQRAAYSNLD